MAGIKIGGNTKVNPTNTYLPYNNAGVFANSAIEQVSKDILRTNFDNLNKSGLYLNKNTKLYQIGDYDAAGNGTILTVDDNNSTIKIDGSVDVVGGLHPPTTSYLKITVKGTPYVISLLTP